MKSDQTVIKVSNLKKAYGEVQAVNGVNFSVGRGEIFGLLGPNGAGKTTTLSILEGLFKADKGNASILGMDIDTDAKAIKRKIGVQLQTTSLLPDLTVYEQVQLFAKLYGIHRSEKELMALLAVVGLTQKASRFPDNLSGGQQKRLALALALVNQPEIVFLDEPTTGLDPQSRRVLWDLICGLRDQGKTIVLTTHYMEEAEVLCDRVGIIDYGRLVALDTPAALINSLEGLSSITTSSNLMLPGIKDLPGINNFSHDGTKLRFQTNDVAATLRGLLDLAEQNHVSLHDLHIKQPNLEDIFLNLTGRMIRG